MEDWIRAAETFFLIPRNYPEHKEAVPSIFRSAKALEDGKLYQQAGRYYEKISEEFPEDKEAPGALYTAGLTYENGEFFDDAISVYNKLISKYGTSEYVADAQFSLGIIFGKLNDPKKEAKAYMSYADKYAQNINKQVASYYRAGIAYQKLKDEAEARKSLMIAAKLYEKYRDKQSLDEAVGAEAHYLLGEMFFKDYMGYKLEGKNPNQVIKSVEKKAEAMGPVLEHFGLAIESQIQIWVLKATFLCGEVFVDMAKAVENQPVFGNKYQQIFARIKTEEGMIDWLDKAAQYYYKNCKFGLEQGLSHDEWIRKSEDMLMWIQYRKGMIFVNAGEKIANSPNPYKKGSEEYNVYQETLDEQRYAAQDKALPMFEAGFKVAEDLFIQSLWNDSIKTQIQLMKPDSPVMTAVIKEKPKVDVAKKEWVDREYERATN
ncbi:MAG: tetratricopeptide repeat protein, partial [Elusimicrobiota bacterium]